MLARALYSAALRLATPLYLLRLFWRGRREPLYRFALPERLGFGLPAMPPRPVWIHAVSLGETRAAAPLIEALRRQRPGQPIVLTHGTATGREAGAALLGSGDAQCWFPFDTPGAVRRFLRQVRPVAGVLMETEIWPNVMHEAARRRVPMVLANARLSARSLARGRRFEALLRPAISSLDVALAQTADDAARLGEAGVAEVEVCGNLKFDMQPDPGQLARGAQWRRSLGTRGVVLMASSREREEAALLAAWAARPAPRPLLVIVPRHPQRFDEVAALVEAAGFAMLRRSRFGDELPAEAAAADVLLGDSMRELPLYYAMGDAALLGGSFEPLGGQNLIEAAACGCPLLMGPHTFNFAEAAAQSIAAGAAERVPDLAAAIDRALAWLQDAGTPARRARALAFAAVHRGAAARMAARIAALLR